MALTGKKRLFANAVLAGSSNKEAAIAAGYSPATAAQSGSRMAKDPAIVDHINERKAAKAPPKKSTAKAPPPPNDEDDLLGTGYEDPKIFLLSAMNNVALEPRQRIDAAKALLPFTHVKLGEGGKKDQKQAAAEKAATGKFGLRAVK